MILHRTYLISNRGIGVYNKARFIRRCSNGMIDISGEVREALAMKKPVVALESTIITHGMRYPHNLETAVEVESIIRNEGASPATIAILNGRIKVGLNLEDLEMLAKNQDNTHKVSRRDIPFMISEKCSGGTTVSGTMLIANKVGIPLFVTGGIGGVHRNGEKTMDVSADLTELGRTPVAVVSAGIKSILDIGRTLEYLETQGVAVATYGATKDFPAFYSRKSGFSVPHCLKSPKEAAEFVGALLQLNLGSGALIAVPIPEEHSLDEREMEKAIEEGIEDSARRNVHGKDITPFLLERISRMTGGGSLTSNIALMKNNAKVGGQISVELSKLRGTVPRGTAVKSEGSEVSVQCRVAEKATEAFRDHFQVVVVGGSNLDNVVHVHSEIKLCARLRKAGDWPSGRNAFEKPPFRAAADRTLPSSIIPGSSVRFASECASHCIAVREVPKCEDAELALTRAWLQRSGLELG